MTGRTRSGRLQGLGARVLASIGRQEWLDRPSYRLEHLLSFAYNGLGGARNGVTNALHGVLTRCNVSASTAASAALWGGRAASLGLGVASFAVGAGLSGLPLAYEVAGKLASGIGTAAAVLSTLTGAMTNDLDRELLQGSVDDIRRDVSDLRDPLQGDGALDAPGRARAADILQALDGPQSPQQLQLRVLVVHLRL